MSKRFIRLILMLILLLYLSPSCLASSLESIQITSPAGGEKWPIGSTQNISWLYAPAITGDAFTVYIANDQGWSHSFPWTGDNGKAVYKWRILDWVDVNRQWRVEVHSADEKYRAYSNYFSTVAKPKIRISEPTPAEAILLGTTKTIRWTVSGDNSNTKVSLYQGPTAVLVKVLANSVTTDRDGNGWFDWLVTGIKPGNDYWICVESVEKAQIKDLSGYFTVSSGKPSINDDNHNKPNHPKNKIPDFQLKMP